MFAISALFFVFPLLAPAVGIVLYPFLLQGLAWVWAARHRALNVPLVMFAVESLGIVTVIDPASGFRIGAFALALFFLHRAVADDRRLDLLIRLGVVHAAITVAQLLLVLVGVELDFSVIFRALYGPLLPSTGMHIDYNAFSQLDLFVPRVAGLNREPAFACLLFTGLAWLAHRSRRTWSTLLLIAAVLCTLSKIAFPVLLALALSLLGRTRPSRRVVSFIGRLALFAGLNLALLAVVRSLGELLELGMALDASFYHRLIGPHTLAFQYQDIAVLGNSVKTLSADPIFADYEFLNDPRAFLDGSVVAKLAVDLGWVAVAIYAIAASWICRSWGAILAIFVAGLFINLVSVAPAAVLTFWIAAGLWRESLPVRRGLAANRPARRSRIRPGVSKRRGMAVPPFDGNLTMGSA